MARQPNTMQQLADIKEQSDYQDYGSSKNFKKNFLYAQKIDKNDHDEIGEYQFSEQSFGKYTMKNFKPLDSNRKQYASDNE